MADNRDSECDSSIPIGNDPSFEVEPESSGLREPSPVSTNYADKQKHVSDNIVTLCVSFVMKYDLVSSVEFRHFFFQGERHDRWIH